MGDDPGAKSMADALQRWRAPWAASAFSRSPQVLLVDDSAVSRYVTCALLVRWGIKPRLACNGAEAVWLACGRGLDLILMDLQMPVMDGVTATTHIRRFERDHGCARVPVVAYTSNTAAADAVLLSEHGIDAVLEKPCPPPNLRECLLRWCGAITALVGSTP